MCLASLMAYVAPSACTSISSHVWSPASLQSHRSSAYVNAMHFFTLRSSRPDFKPVVCHVSPHLHLHCNCRSRNKMHVLQGLLLYCSGRYPHSQTAQCIQTQCSQFSTPARVSETTSRAAQTARHPQTASCPPPIL